MHRTSPLSFPSSTEFVTSLFYRSILLRLKLKEGPKFFFRCGPTAWFGLDGWLWWWLFDNDFEFPIYIGATYVIGLLFRGKCLSDQCPALCRIFRKNERKNEKPNFSTRLVCPDCWDVWKNPRGTTTGEKGRRGDIFKSTVAAPSSDHAEPVSSPELNILATSLISIGVTSVHPFPCPFS